MSSYWVTAWLPMIPMAAPGWPGGGRGVIAGHRQREGRGGARCPSVRCRGPAMSPARTCCHASAASPETTYRGPGRACGLPGGDPGGVRRRCCRFRRARRRLSCAAFICRLQPAGPGAGQRQDHGDTAEQEDERQEIGAAGHNGYDAQRCRGHRDSAQHPGRRSRCATSRARGQHDPGQDQRHGQQRRRPGTHHHDRIRRGSRKRHGPPPFAHPEVMRRPGYAAAGDALPL